MKSKVPGTTGKITRRLGTTANQAGCKDDLSLEFKKDKDSEKSTSATGVPPVTYTPDIAATSEITAILNRNEESLELLGSPNSVVRKAIDPAKPRSITYVTFDSNRPLTESTFEADSEVSRIKPALPAAPVRRI